MPEAFEVGPIKATLRADYQQYEASFSSIIKQTRQLDTALAEADKTIAATESATKAAAAAQQQVTTTTRAMETATQEAVTATREAVAATRQVEPAAKEAAAGMAAYDREARQAAEANRGLKGSLDDVKARLGKKSLFGDLVEVFLGGGAVAAVTIAADQIGRALQGIIKARDDLADGEKGKFQIADELTRSIPVLGQFYSAFSGVRELLTGEQGITRAIERSAQRVNAALDLVGNLRRATDQLKASSSDTIETINRQLRDLKLSGVALELARISDALKDAKRANQETTKQSLNSEDRKAAIESLRAGRERAASLQDAVRDAQQVFANVSAADYGAVVRRAKDRLDLAQSELATQQQINRQLEVEAKSFERAALAEQKRNDAKATELARQEAASAIARANEEARAGRLSGAGDYLGKVDEGNSIDTRRRREHLLQDLIRQGILLNSDYAAGVQLIARLQQGEAAEAATRAAASVRQLGAQIDQWGLSARSQTEIQLRAAGATKEWAAQGAKLAETLEQLQKIDRVQGRNDVDTFNQRIKLLRDAVRDGIITAKQFAEAQQRYGEELTQSLKAQADAVKQQVQTPLEKYRDEIDRLEALARTGLIDPETLRRAKKQAKDELLSASLEQRRAFEEAKNRAPDATAYGSQQAADLLARSLNAERVQGPRKIEEQTLEELKRQTKLIEQAQRNGQGPSVYGKF